MGSNATVASDSAAAEAQWSSSRIEPCLLQRHLHRLTTNQFTLVFVETNLNKTERGKKAFTLLQFLNFILN